jgi:signal transduction histidine kinase
MKFTQDTILVVDDNPTNLSVLFDTLERAGYRVLINARGASALDIAAQVLPDLILLDVMMPGIDGYETCRRLKENPVTRGIPVIFMTALSDVVDEVRGLQTGAVDYISKPIHVERVLARVEIHLTIRKLQRQLELKNAELDSFSHTVAHDLKNPLGNLVSYSRYLGNLLRAKEWDNLEELVEGIEHSAKKAVFIVDELLLLASVRKENIQTVPVKMSIVIEQALKRTELMVAEYQAEVTVPDQWPTVLGYHSWLEEVWVNYISNGIKYGGRPPLLKLGATNDVNGMVCFWIKDNGPGLDEAAQAKLFAEFARLDQLRAQGHGLGLSIVQRIVNKLGGTVGVDSRPGQGSRFYFTLPTANT